MKKLDLSSGVAVATGAASGIGRATALTLARRGCAVALCDRDADGLASAADEARALGASVTTHAFDVADADAVAALPESVLAEHGRVSVLVNAAGVSLMGRFADVTMDEFRWLIEINLFGTVGMTKAFLPALMREPQAQVVNLSSLFGIIAPAGQTAYSASKFGVRGFSESLRHEMEGTGLGVTVVHPGGVVTGIARNAHIAAGADQAAERALSDRFERAFLKTPAAEVGEAIARAAEARKPRLVVADGARAGERLLDGEGGPRDIGAPHVHERHRMARRGHVRGRDPADLGDGVDDRRELGRQPLELAVVEVDPRQLGQVPDLIGADIGHASPPVLRVVWGRSGVDPGSIRGRSSLGRGGDGPVRARGHGEEQGSYGAVVTRSPLPIPIRARLRMVWDPASKYPLWPVDPVIARPSSGSTPAPVAMRVAP